MTPKEKKAATAGIFGAFANKQDRNVDAIVNSWKNRQKNVQKNHK